MDAYSKYCQQLKDKNHYRKLSLPTNGGDYSDFTHNDYLGLSRHRELIAGAVRAGKQFGVGATASRSIKDYALIQQLEKSIANLKHKDTTIIFNSGAQTNISCLAALLDRQAIKGQALVFSDRLNHASTHMGCQLAGVKQYRYQHLDYQHLESLLIKYATPKQKAFIISESLFSMDGDMADIQQLIRIAKQYNAILYLDEAHAFGVYGKNGLGLSTGFESQIDVIMASFSKALGCGGGFVTINKNISEYLLNRAKGFIYSTGLSPLIVGAANAAIKLLPSLCQQREALQLTAIQLRASIKKLGFDTGSSQSQIIPIIFKSAAEVLKVQEFLSSKGVLVSAIRPPTVPANSCRLRISLSSLHSKTDIDKLITALQLL